VPCRQSREMRFKAALALMEAGESEALIFTKAVSAGADELTIAAETADGDLVVEIRGTDVRPTTPMSDRVGALGGQVVRTSGTLRVRIPCGFAQRLVNCRIAHRHHPFVRCACASGAPAYAALSQTTSHAKASPDNPLFLGKLPAGWWWRVEGPRCHRRSRLKGTCQSLLVGGLRRN
jgi:hypothetical protein